MNGLKRDVLIEITEYEDERTGLKIRSDQTFTVWAKAGLSEKIKSVEGVTNVYTTLCNTQYSVFIDKRYDIDYIIREVEAVILCEE